MRGGFLCCCPRRYRAHHHRLPCDPEGRRAIKIACDGTEDLTPKLVQYGIAIISLSIVFSVFQISSGELQSSKELSELVKDSYYLGSQSKGGGAIGAVAAVPLAKLLGDIGAVILCIGIAIILLPRLHYL